MRGQESERSEEMIRSYEDLEVYKKAYKLAIALYRRTKAYPKEDQYSLADQLRRASYSIPLNIAEGHGKRASTAEFKRYLQMSMGSCNEVAVLLDMSRDLELIAESEYGSYKEQVIEIRKMISGLAGKWSNLTSDI